MERILRCFWLLLAVLLVRVSAAEAACSSYGVDYSNGGAYYIDGSSNQYFSFITVFQGLGSRRISCEHDKLLMTRLQVAIRRASTQSLSGPMTTSMPARPSTPSRLAPR